MIKLPRAFLSHSSTDKGVVGEVAKHLGRAAVIFDAFEFKAGDDLQAAILKGLERADLFILFASKVSLVREWVKFEISAASKSLTNKSLSRVVTYIIDEDVQFDEIPDWMKSTLVVRQSKPGLIAIDIRRLINQRITENIPNYFVGRRNELERALEIISEFTDPNFRPPLILYGLRGIGRRSLVRNIARDSLSYSTITPIALQSGDLLPETYIRTSEVLSPGGILDYAQALAAQVKLSTTERVEGIVALLRSACGAGSLPVIADDDAISAENGKLRPEFEALYDAIASQRDVDAMIVTGRRLYGAEGRALPSLRVPELDPTSTQGLLRLSARDVGLSFDRSDLTSIATYTRGYPPAVRFAVDEARTRGIAQLVANQRALVNFSAELFLRQLKRENSLNERMAKILQILSSYSPLPLSVISDYCGADTDEISNDIDHLLDMAFILPEGVNYRITEPLRDAAYRAFDGLVVDSGRVASLLDEYLRNEPDDDARLSLGQVIFRASLLSGGKSKSRFAVGFAADLIQVATQSYHDQDYDLAIKYGSNALEARPDNIEVRRYVAQALIRKERYAEAEDHVNALIEFGQIKEALYIQGFAARRRREYSKAIDYYKKSLAYGHGGVAIHRELASSYFELGNLREAEAHIRQAEERSPHNRYVVDLRCTIALRSGDLGSGLIDHSQKMTAAAIQMADMKVWAHRS